MISDTTINVHHAVLNKILEAVELTDIKRNTIIVLLLRYAMKEHPRRKTHLTGNGQWKLNSRILYQDRDTLKRWKCVHVWFSREDAVFCHDMRRFYCMSVSNILAYAVSLYLDEIIEMLLEIENEERISDNYLYEKYCCTKISYKYGMRWTQQWLKPLKT